ncbi:MAG TPA: DHHA1 domain-containing protein, partial [Paracoccus sp. (in: a-proteobacteria)]|nr:DHHA1 domain-containing protein [Paracoccus sp. (in: a-proteobacteria)]
GDAAPKDIGGVSLIARTVSGVSGKELGALADQMRQQLGSGAVLVMAEDGGKATVAATVTPDLSDRISAVAMVQAAVAALGGKGGGGRPDRAQGGAPSLEQADAAVAAVETLIAGAA